MEFEDGTEDKITAIDIAHIMYSQYKPDGNQYLILDSIFDFLRRTTDLCYTDQNVVKKWTHLQAQIYIWMILVPWLATVVTATLSYVTCD